MLCTNALYICNRLDQIMPERRKQSSGREYNSGRVSATKIPTTLTELRIRARITLIIVVQSAPLGKRKKEKKKKNGGARAH